MTCTCPKCNVAVDIDISKIPETGTFMPCPECKSRFWVAREAYARMTLKKEGFVYCDRCGKELRCKIVCGSCGVMYPDYYLVQTSKPPRREAEKRDIFSSFALKPSRPTQTYDYKYTSTKKSTGRSPGFNLQKIGALVIVVLIVAGLGFYYQMEKAEQKFAANYMRALYAIKTGNDLSINTCTKISTEWRQQGEGFVPRISTNDKIRLDKVKDHADRYIKKLNEPPKKFIDNKTKLVKLYNIYSKSYELASAPSGSLSSFDNSVAKSQSEFNSLVTTLKQNMPGALSKEFEVAKTKYKGLENI